MTTDNFCFYLQNRLIQTSQTGGQRYSDTSPLVFPSAHCLIEPYPSGPYPTQAYPTRADKSGVFLSGPWPSGPYPSGSYPNGAHPCGAYTSRACTRGAPEWAQFLACEIRFEKRSMIYLQFNNGIWLNVLWYDDQRPETVFFGQKLMLCPSFRCDQIHHYQRHESGHTLLCYLSLT